MAAIQERYWRQVIQSRYDAFYASRYAAFAERLDDVLAVFAALVASGSIAAWAYWETHQKAWAVLIGLSQVLAVVKQFLPFKKRIVPMKTLADGFEEIALRAEAKWFAVSESRLTEDEINDLLTRLKKDHLDVTRKCMGMAIIPFNSLVRWHADHLTKEYCSHQFGQTVITTEK